MKNNSKIIILISMLLLFLVSQGVDASSYREQKELASNGKSSVFESFLKAIPVETSPQKGKDLNEDYSDLISKYKSNSSIDTIKSISVLFTIIDPEQVKSFAELNQNDLVNKISKSISDTEILNLVVARSNRIAKAKDEWLASLNIYPQTIYLQDLLSAFQPFTEGLSTGIGNEYQQDMIQMHYPTPGMLQLRGRIVDADVKMAWLDYMKETRDALADTRLLLAEIQKGEEMISINKENTSLLTTLRDVTRVQYEAGSRSFADIVRLETELDKSRDSLNRMISMQEGSISNLLSMLDIPVNARLSKIQWTLDESPDIDINQLRPELPQIRQELQKMALDIEKMDAMIKMTLIQAAPDKTLGFSYFQGRDITSLDSKTETPSGMESGDMSNMDSNSQMEMAKDDFMNKPMVDYRQSNFALDSSWAVELVNRKDAMAEMLKTDINMENGMLEMLYKNYSQMVKSEKLYGEKIIPKAKAALEVVRKGYSANENDFNDLISAELAYLMARMDLANTAYERRKSLIEMARTYGKSFSIGKPVKVIIPGGNEQ